MRGRRHTFIIGCLVLILLPALSLGEQPPTFPIINGKINYNLTDISKFPPLTGEDYVQVTIPAIYISQKTMGWWGLTAKNDIALSLSVDNGDGKLRVYEIDTIRGQRSGRFVPVFNSIVMPVELLRGTYLRFHVEGYLVYGFQVERFKTDSKIVLDATKPFLQEPYGITAGMVLDGFNALLGMKQSDKIFEFTISFDVLAHDYSVRQHDYLSSTDKLERQLLLRPIKYPVININDRYPLTTKKITQGNRYFPSGMEWFLPVSPYSYDLECGDTSAENVSLENDILYISCDGKKEEVRGSSYLIFQVSPWSPPYRREPFYVLLRRLFSKWETTKPDVARATLEDARNELNNSDEYSGKTKEVYCAFIRLLDDYYLLIDNKGDLKPETSLSPAERNMIYLDLKQMQEISDGDSIFRKLKSGPIGPTLTMYVVELGPENINWINMIISKYQTTYKNLATAGKPGETRFEFQFFPMSGGTDD